MCLANHRAEDKSHTPEVEVTLLVVCVVFYSTRQNSCGVSHPPCIGRRFPWWRQGLDLTWSQAWLCAHDDPPSSRHAGHGARQA